jgi:hypothetical protein
MPSRVLVGRTFMAAAWSWSMQHLTMLTPAWMSCGHAQLPSSQATKMRLQISQLQHERGCDVTCNSAVLAFNA